MGLAISTVAALIANPGTNFTAAAAATGDSLTIPAFNASAPGMMTEIIRGGATAGAVRVTSPRLHDTTRGITFYTDKARTIFQLPREVGQNIYPTDALSVSLTGGTAETDDAYLTFYMTDLPGVAARLAMWDEIKGKIDQIKPVVVNPDPDTAGQWASVALNSVEDLLDAGADYAVLGFQVDAAVDVVAVRGPDTGNYRIGCPGDDSTIVTADFFLRRSVDSGLPYIPILNSANKAATFIDCADATATAEPNVSVILGRLTSPFGG